MRNRIPECLCGLAGKGAATSVRYGAGHHHRNLHAMLLAILIDGEQRGFTVQGVEYGLHHEEVDTAVHQAANALRITGDQLIE